MPEQLVAFANGIVGRGGNNQTDNHISKFKWAIADCSFISKIYNLQSEIRQLPVL